MPPPVPGTISLSGRATLNGGTPAGITFTLSGDATAVAQIDAGGNYSFANLAPGGSYTVIASKPGWRFTPESYTFIGGRSSRVSDFAATADDSATPSPGAIVRFIDLGDSCPECAASGANPIDNSAYFVINNYLDFLGRGPDTAGLQFWTNEINTCGSNQQCREVKRINVSAAFFLSIEFQETGYLVYRLQRASYGRMPMYRQLMSDAGEVSAGVQVGIGDWETRLASNRRAFAEGWAQRAEFRARYEQMSDEEYVSALVSNAGLTLNSERVAQMSGALRAGTATRAAVLLEVADEADFKRAETNRAFVLMQYYGYLRRDPDEGGYNFWLGKLNQFGGNFVKAEMVKAFITSIEFRNRFERP